MPLLERVGRNVRLTAAAQALVAHTDALLARMEEAEADLQATAEQITGTVRVAAIQSAGLYLLAPALRRLRAAPPGAARRGHRRRARDVAAAPRARHARPRARRPVPVPPARRPTTGSTSSRCWRSSSGSCCPGDHPLAREAGPVSLAALRDEPWATGKDDSHYGELTIRACRDARRLRAGRPPPLQRPADAARAGRGRPGGDPAARSRAAPEREPSVVIRDVAEARLTRTVFGAIRRGSARRPALNALRAALRDTAAGLRSAATPAPGSRPCAWPAVSPPPSVAARSATSSNSAPQPSWSTCTASAPGMYSIATVASVARWAPASASRTTR